MAKNLMLLSCVYLAKISQGMVGYSIYLWLSIWGENNTVKPVQIQCRGKSRWGYNGISPLVHSEIVCIQAKQMYQIPLGKMFLLKKLIMYILPIPFLLK